MRQDTPLELIPDQWHDFFHRFCAGEDVGPEMIDPSVGDPVIRGTVWLGQRFRRFIQEQQEPMVEAVVAGLESSSSSSLLPELLSLTGAMGASALRDPVQAIFESTENTFVQRRALHALLEIEMAATERGEARTPAVYQFWDELMGDSNPELATWGFEGLRNSDLVRAVGSLDRFFGTGKPPDRIARTLRGMRRDAIRQSIDIGPALKDFLRAHPDLSEAHLGMMREAFGEALMSASSVPKL